MTIYTIGFAKKSAEQFFEALRYSTAKRLLDIRLRNTSQLAGFTKREDLRYFLKQMLDMEYQEVPLLAPEDTLLRDYRKTRDWLDFEQRYLDLIKQRQVENQIERHLFEDGAVLLCSEPKPDKCHRRLAAEYLAHSLVTGADIIHL